MRQGGDQRLPLELALIKVTRAGADIERESLAFRVEQFEVGENGETEPQQQRPAENEALRSSNSLAQSRLGGRAGGLGLPGL